MDTMTKETFKLFTDPDTNLKYLKPVQDEETKNHKEYDQDITTGFMPEMPDNKYYPIQSYLTYLYSLNKNYNLLWQTPRYTNFPADPKVREWYGP